MRRPISGRASEETDALSEFRASIEGSISLAQFLSWQRMPNEEAKANLRAIALLDSNYIG